METLKKVVGSVIRHAVGAVGVREAIVGEDDITKIAGALMTIGAVVWSIWQKTRKPPEGGSPIAQ